MFQEYRSDRLEHVLQALHLVIDGIIESVIVNNDGLVVSSFPPDNDKNPNANPHSIPRFAAMSSALLGLVQKTLDRFEMGELQRLMIDSDQGVIIAYPAGRAMIVVLLNKNAEVASAIYSARQAAEEISEILEDRH